MKVGWTQSAFIISMLLIVPRAKGEPAFSVGVDEAGGVRVEVNGDQWLIESAFSYRGTSIGYNCLGFGETKGQPGWKPERQESGQGTFQVKAQGKPYRLERTVEVQGHRIAVSDTLTNSSAEDVGILLEHSIKASGALTDIRLCGGATEAAIYAENPTVFARQARSALGTVAEDDAFRCQFHASRAEGRASFGMRHLGLPSGRSIKLQWSIYPLAGDATSEGGHPAGRLSSSSSAGNADYFEFINRLRADWDVNYTIPGPGDWMDVTRPEVREMILDPVRLRGFLEHQGLKVVLLVPWLDYDNINRLTDRPTTRDEYKRFMTEAYDRFKTIDPEIKLLGCIEAPFVSLPQDLVDQLVAVIPPPKKSGYHEMTPEMLGIFKQHPQAWKQWGDSIVWARGGKAHYEYYIRGGRQQVEMLALTVRPVIGNGQHDYLMDQARFIVEEVGLDGYYVDSFTGAQHWHYGYSYDKWDGITVDIDAKTGQITDRYTDLALAGAGARRALIEYGVKRGKIVVLNGHPIDRGTQALPAIFFNESEWVFEPLKWMDVKPPLEQRPCEAHLSSPIALGFRPGRSGEEGTKRYAEFIMKGAIAYLRHGITYFHYQTQIPETGPGSGEYGPFKHMFPITPVRLGEGFIEGTERTVTCVSGLFDRPGEREPRIVLFDLHGRPVPHAMQPRRIGTGWQVDLQLADWQSIAILE